jgi:hypothetical protein
MELLDSIIVIKSQNRLYLKEYNIIKFYFGKNLESCLWIYVIRIN